MVEDQELAENMKGQLRQIVQIADRRFRQESTEKTLN